jgi:hypothetical protein
MDVFIWLRIGGQLRALVSNELSGSVKCWGFLEWLSNCLASQEGLGSLGSVELLRG